MRGPKGVPTFIRRRLGKVLKKKDEEYFALMELPRELRDMIYTLALFDNTKSKGPQKYSFGAPARVHIAEPRFTSLNPLTRRQRFIRRLLRREMTVDLFTRAKTEPTISTALSLFLTSKTVKIEAQDAFFRNAILESQSLTKREEILGIIPYSHVKRNTFICLRLSYPPAIFNNIRYLNIFCSSTDVPELEENWRIITERKLGWVDKNTIQKYNLAIKEDQGLFRLWKHNIFFAVSLPNIRKVVIDLRDCRWWSTNISRQAGMSNNPVPPRQSLPPPFSAVPLGLPSYGPNERPSFAPTVTACHAVIKIIENALWLRAQSRTFEDHYRLEVHLLVPAWATRDVQEGCSSIWGWRHGEEKMGDGKENKKL